VAQQFGQNTNASGQMVSAGIDDSRQHINVSAEGNE